MQRGQGEDVGTVLWEPLGKGVQSRAPKLLGLGIARESPHPK